MGKRGPLLGMIYVQVAYAAMFLITRLAFTTPSSCTARSLRPWRSAPSLASLTGTFTATKSTTACTGNAASSSFLWFSSRHALVETAGSPGGLEISGLAYTSSTLVSTMNNLQPAITFLLAYLLRYGKVVFLYCCTLVGADRLGDQTGGSEHKEEDGTG
ncbi:hypothetical protein B296_00049363 [Ensete ventricosum]|uniref:WAT1-related protein n=1 Tax=Ensete ventricosum TaxID=4639 RepID=A0A426XAL7_ENSVE|nr:hypothetical protein B296_00049363 [Ensete ventricosum]